MTIGARHTAAMPADHSRVAGYRSQQCSVERQCPHRLDGIAHWLMFDHRPNPRRIQVERHKAGTEEEQARHRYPRRLGQHGVLNSQCQRRHKERERDAERDGYRHPCRDAGKPVVEAETQCDSGAA